MRATCLSLLAMLEECAEFLADQADADMRPDGGYVGNGAMKLLVHVKEAIASAERELIAEDQMR